VHFTAAASSTARKSDGARIGTDILAAGANQGSRSPHRAGFGLSSWGNGARLNQTQTQPSSLFAAIRRNWTNSAEFSS